MVLSNERTRIGGGSKGNGVLVAAAVIAALALPLTLVMLYQAPAEPLESNLFAMVVVLAVLLHGTGFASRWLPRTAFAVGSALMLLFALVEVPDVGSAAMLPTSVTYLLLVWNLAVGESKSASIGALAVGFIGAGVITVIDIVRGTIEEPLLWIVQAGTLVVGILAAWALGALTRQRRISAEQRLEEQTRRALAEERTRIGRDLHDVVSHSLAVMIAQTEAARVLTADTEADEALEKVAETGRSAMQGLRGMLRFLDRPDSEPRNPTPEIRDIPDLIEGARSNGHVIEFSTHGRERDLSPDASLAIYRLVQEAVTNAVRHVAPPLSIDVALHWHERTLEVTVEDDGGSGENEPPSSGTGTGLIGMRERIAGADGILEVRPGSGWRIRAELPIKEAS